MPFVKLDTGALDSTLWVDREARELFITALLMAEPFELKEETPQIAVEALTLTGFMVPPGWYGFVRAAGPGICRRALVPMAEGMAALKRLGEPDGESRTPDFAGRRMVRVDGGYIILNYDAYRQKDYGNAERCRRYRERQQRERQPKSAAPDMHVDMPDMHVATRETHVTTRGDTPDMQAEAYQNNTLPAPAAPEPAREPQESPRQSPKPPKANPPKAGDRNALVDAVAFSCGLPLDQLTKSVLARCQKVVNEAREAQPGILLTPNEISRRATNYRALWPNVPLTPEALQKHWVACDKGRREDAAAKPPPEAPPGWFAWFAVEFAKVSPDDAAHGQLLAAYRGKAFHMLPKSWQKRAWAAEGKHGKAM